MEFIKEVSGAYLNDVLDSWPSSSELKTIYVVRIRYVYARPCTVHNMNSSDEVTSTIYIKELHE